jgi:hypothetical protein
MIVRPNKEADDEGKAFDALESRVKVEECDHATRAVANRDKCQTDSVLAPVMCIDGVAYRVDASV